MKGGGWSRSVYKWNPCGPSPSGEPSQRGVAEVVWNGCYTGAVIKLIFMKRKTCLVTEPPTPWAEGESSTEKELCPELSRTKKSLCKCKVREAIHSLAERLRSLSAEAGIPDLNFVFVPLAIPLQVCSCALFLSSVLSVGPTMCRDTRLIPKTSSECCVF